MRSLSQRAAQPSARSADKPPKLPKSVSLVAPTANAPPSSRAKNVKTWETMKQDLRRTAEAQTSALEKYLAKKRPSVVNSKAAIVQNVSKRQYARRRDVGHPQTFRSTPPSEERQKLSDYGRVRVGGAELRAQAAECAEAAPRCGGSCAYETMACDVPLALGAYRTMLENRLPVASAGLFATASTTATKAATPAATAPAQARRR